MLPKHLVAWMEKRLGYGSPTATAWFLGLEESCHCEDELDARTRGGGLEDLETALLRTKECYPHLLSDDPDLQPTWRPLMRAWIRTSTATEPTEARLRQYQRHNLGRSDSDHLLVELLPLPAPSTSSWPYARFGLTRPEYVAAWLPKRVAFLAQQWSKWPTRKRVAIAYGKDRWDAFRKVFRLEAMDGAPVEGTDGRALGFRLDGIGVVLSEHPVAYGLKNEYWDAIGRWLRRSLYGTNAPVAPIVRRKA